MTGRGSKHRVVSLFSSRSSDIQLNIPRDHLLHSGVVFLLLMVVYAWSMPVVITLEDAGLLQMVCHYNGLAHPPGYPLFTLICPEISQISWLDPIISGNLMSALFASLAGMIVFHIVLLATRQVTAAYVAALCLGFSAAFWSQAIIIEVYALNIFLFCLLAFLMCHYSRSAQIRFLYLFVFIYGLALSNHWPLVVLSTPALIVMLLPVYQPLWLKLKLFRTWLVLGVLIIAGLLPYVTLVLKQDPFISLYGEVDGMSEFITYVSRSAYAAGTSTADWQDKVLYMGWLCYEISLQFGWIANAVILVGMVHSRSYISGALNLACWLAFLGSTFLLMLLVNFDYTYKYEAIFKPYPLVSYAVMSIWLAFGFKFLVESMSARWPQLKPAVLKGGLGVLLVLSTLMQNYAVNYRHDDNLAEDYAATILDLVKPGANLFLYGDNEIGPVGFMHHVRGIRPDITVYAASNLVFNNALGSPRASWSEQKKRMLGFVASTESSSYFLSPTFITSGVDYGLFIEHRAGSTFEEQREYVFDEKITRFLENILSRYERQQITDPHSLIFVHNLLLRFSRQYIGYAFEHDPAEPLADDFLDRLQRLQKTFPGRLMTLDYVFQNKALIDNRPRVPKQLLLQMVVDGDASMPIETSSRNRAVFYELAGHVTLLDSDQHPPDKRAAAVLFRMSFDNYPAADNASLCQLMRIHQQLAQTTELQELKMAFPATFETCINGIAAESI